jgi:hypothetical protein
MLSFNGAKLHTSLDSDQSYKYYISMVNLYTHLCYDMKDFELDKENHVTLICCNTNFTLKCK